MAENRPWVLLTNDDGPDSPALTPLVRELSQVAEVTVLVPRREYSWSSKTMSRFARIELCRQERDGVEFLTADGSPADCANLGIHNLRDRKPDLVVSGINIGANAGLSFLLSSGTVGAAVEGMLSGVPAAAFSLQLGGDDYQRWRSHQDSGQLAHTWTQAAIVAREITTEILADGLPRGASVLSINMPPGVTAQTARQFAGVTPSSYGSFFERGADGKFQHHRDDIEIGDGPAIPSERPGDLLALKANTVAITPLQFELSAEPTPSDRLRFERGSARSPI